MTWRVMKFGGTTVGTPDRLATAVGLIRKARAEGRVAVVVSALGDTTDVLLDATRHAAAGETEAALALVDTAERSALATLAETAERLGRETPRIANEARALLAPLRDALRGASAARLSDPAFTDFVLSFGERLSATLVPTLLRAAGVPARTVDARAWVVTDAAFGHALPDRAASFERLRDLAAQWLDDTPVVTGFIGATNDGRTTTLGRNGSDYTAALLATGLDASELTTWTDVPGVMTADPAVVPDAHLVPHLTHDEAFELAHLGLRMFHQRAMELLRDARIPLRIRNSLAPDEPGTRVDATVVDADLDRPTSVVSRDGLALLDLTFADAAIGRHVGERALSVLAAERVSVLVALQSPAGRGLSVLVPDAERARAEAALASELSDELATGAVEPLRTQAPVTQVTLLAEAMGRGANVAGRLFAAVGGVGVNVRTIAQGASCRSISFVVDAAEAALAVRTVHAAFNFAHTEVNLLLLGKGVVGGALLEQIRAQRETLRRDHGVLLKVAGVVDSARALFDDEGLALDGWRTRFECSDTSPDVAPLLERLRRRPVPVLVDCTAAGGMETLYQQSFARGVHVVAANKKPLTLPVPERDALLRAARRGHVHYHYETTVGASLPVIETLKDLVRTGDRVRLIEGSFSGTLGFLSNELEAGTPLSVAVARAQERGYTEPHPADDLSGLDAARKALILARELGLPLGLEDVQVEPFVPREVLGETSLEGFFAALRLLDGSMAARLGATRREGKVLRYLARIDPQAPPGRTLVVGPVFIDRTHAAARLRGSEAFVAFTTERYNDFPLIVQGAGAGGPVTAAGVLADVLKIAQRLRGR